MPAMFASANALRQLLASAVILTLSSMASADESASDVGARFYEIEVQPILQAHCYSCHAGAPGKEVESGFDMTTRASLVQGGDYGPAVDEASPGNSALLRAINYDDLEMPPKGKLPQSQIAILTRWVTMGAPWSDAAPVRHGPPPVDDRARRFWSFRPVARAEVPEVKNRAWVQTPVDAFVLAKLDAAGLEPAPPVRKTSLLRRIYYDLIGLPPLSDDVQAFLADESPDAYERVVDRLLASPQYGERWARHWLDLVRYAETNGYEFDRVKPEAWRYRDYVIRSFNGDKPYDQFVREQLAGDELDEETADGVIATGYYKLGPFDGGAPDKLQAEFDELDDIMATTGQVFLGLTVNCARCHDHKVDPLPTADYYRMLAFFRGIQRGGRDSTRPIVLGSDIEAARERIADWQREVNETSQAIRTIESALRPHLAGGERDDFRNPTYRRDIVRKHSPEHVPPETLTRYETLVSTYDRLQDERPSEMARALGVAERGPRPPQTHVLVRGSPYAPGEAVEPGFPSVLTREAPQIPTPARGARSSGRRRVLAEWIASADNPLTARVLVNRLWHHHFNRGIVRTTSDFGYGGAPPTHPELLDWLANELVRGGWRLKPLHKLMVMSSAYQMSTVACEESLADDPENDLFSRFELRRLSAEEIRDSILAVSGKLNPKMGGPSIFPNIADEVHAGQSRPGEGWKDSSPEEQARRSVYIHVKRSLIVPLLSVFDAADTDATCPVRFATTQPTQALTMLNSEFLSDQAAVFAESVRNTVGKKQSEQIAEALRRVTQREPTAAEIERGVAFMRRMRGEHGQSEDAALAKFCLLAMNMNEFMYLD
jgi:hypothetical protein